LLFFFPKDVCCPYGLIYGGTDLNEYATDPCYKDIILQAVTNARSLYCFSDWSFTTDWGCL